MLGLWGSCWVVAVGVLLLRVIRLLEREVEVVGCADEMGGRIRRGCRRIGPR